MLHQALSLAQLPTGRQGLQVSSTLTPHKTIYSRKIQLSGLLLEQQAQSVQKFL
jgi:hypothetical protein